jgi:hypothetical protein
MVKNPVAIQFDNDAPGRLSVSPGQFTSFTVFLVHLRTSSAFIPLKYAQPLGLIVPSAMLHYYWLKCQESP